MNEPQRYHHICASSGCDCHLTRRDLLRLGALSTAAVAAPLLAAGQARAQAFKGDDQPVRIGYLPITDATPLLVAHARQLYEAEGLRTEAPRLFRSWAQLVEAFVAGQVNVIHLLSPATLWVRYGTRFPAKIVAWNHTNGSALTVAPQIGSVRELGGKTVAIPFWYSIHNIVLQRLLRENGLVPVVRPRDGTLRDNEVNLVVLPPAEMVSALAGRAIAGFIVADPFNAAAETLGVGKVLRFTGDVWKDHACCVLTLAERDTVERPNGPSVSPRRPCARNCGCVATRPRRPSYWREMARASTRRTRCRCSTRCSPPPTTKATSAPAWSCTATGRSAASTSSPTPIRATPKSWSSRCA